MLLIGLKRRSETSTNARRARRNRKTPCRQPRQNRPRGPIPPSTKACGQFKIRVVKVFDTIFPLSGIGIEDVKALTKKGCHKWNTSFSPLEVGKKWCYSELEIIAPVTQLDGYTDTYLTRQRLGLKKSKAKLSNVFDAHCVDSWVLAYLLVGGDISLKNMVVMECKPIRIYRRQLHVFNPGKNGYCRPYGGSMSQGLKRGGIVKHPKYGKCYVGGEDAKKSRISRNCLGKLLCI